MAALSVYERNRHPVHMSQRRASFRVTRGLAVLGVVILATAGCAPPEPDPAATPAAFQFDIARDFPDPDVVADVTGYVAYATNGADVTIQVATSPDLTTWSLLADDALPDLPDWAVAGDTWAPDVSMTAHGKFRMYFTATDRASGYQCIGTAHADSALGPFTPDPGVVACPVDRGGAIDPATFTGSDGTTFLLFKNDGNCCGIDTWIWIAPVTADGLALAADPTRLLTTDLPWEGSVVEAPTLVERDGAYVMFYSANDYNSLEYAIGYATAASPLGPFTKAGEPLLTTDSSGYLFFGPGGQDVVTGGDGDDRLVFHSWNADHTARGLDVLPLTWNAGVPSVELPR